MSKLYFKHGTVASAKTLNLLSVAHSYKLQGKNVIVMKPTLDTRYGLKEVTSRAGLSLTADFLIGPSTNILKLVDPKNSVPIERNKTIHCILVDEAQFLEAEQIDQLRLVTVKWNVPVICYGLRTDFRANLFAGSKRLMELADCIEEVRATCHFCNKKAIFNLKHVNGLADTTGPVVQLGAEERYFPTCFQCYLTNLNQAGPEQVPVRSWVGAVPAAVDSGDAIRLFRSDDSSSDSDSSRSS
eukprot:CAMPEP_0201094344 /NCGR_PEP_ID=MMETSP0812-20130820/2666_1 /ASSEMBLY_ACC=CAM_ASM_000668 /TAXON_ID=98059 /ORGANISM="Dinobryon sp., Strain UTEXLB2267" /LENGTH=241 /DNA_ID=CAMNT_0047346867 /DNA_START=36 /DNA_END=761 /DNA_ORIENTATION=+